MKTRFLLAVLLTVSHAMGAIVALETLPGASSINVTDSMSWQDPRDDPFHNPFAVFQVTATSYFGGWGYELMSPSQPLTLGASVSSASSFYNPVPQRQYIASQSVWHNCGIGPPGTPACPSEGTYSSIPRGAYGIAVTLADGVHYGWVEVIPSGLPVFNQRSALKAFVESQSGVAAVMVPEPSASLTLAAAGLLLCVRRRTP